MNPIESQHRVEPYTVWHVGLLLTASEDTDHQAFDEALSSLDEAVDNARDQLALAGLTFGLVVDVIGADGTHDRFQHVEQGRDLCVCVTVRVPVATDAGLRDTVVVTQPEAVPGIQVLIDLLTECLVVLDGTAFDPAGAIVHVEADLAETRWQQMVDAVNDAYGPVLARLEGALLHMRDDVEHAHGQQLPDPVMHLGVDRTGPRPVVHGVPTFWFGVSEHADRYGHLSFGRYLPAEPLSGTQPGLPADGRIMSRNVTLPYPRVELVDDDQWACEITDIHGHTHLVVGELDEVIADTIDLIETTSET